ncbi:MAG: radical SAM protein [Nitrospirae bacterium]|nr:radical SAM protein [Nitrospirota bacterium]
MEDYKMTDPKLSIKNHPCLSVGAHGKYARLHLPVAPDCNVQCRYCVRKYDCVNESRPGVTSKVLTPVEAMQRVRVLMEREGRRISVIGIAGPGDPLFNDATIETFERIHLEFPELILCVSTNGLLLPDKLGDLVRVGVSSVTVTISAVSAETAERIYSFATYGGNRYTGAESAALILARQWEGLGLAIDAGMTVKVNTVFAPGVNDHEIPFIARKAGRMDAYMMNILPLIPQGGFKAVRRPGHDELIALRTECAPYIKQMGHCRQCRADAFGALGEDRDMELEVFHSKLGEEYCEMVV